MTEKKKTNFFFFQTEHEQRPQDGSMAEGTEDQQGSKYSWKAEKQGREGQRGNWFKAL